MDRFSEDLDFTLLKPDPGFKLAPYFRAVKDELTSFGFEAGVEVKEKKHQTAVESAFVKAGTLVHLIKVDAKARATKGELLQVKFEVDENPPPGCSTEAKPFFWPHPFSVTTCDLPSLFAGKLHAMFCRPRVQNVKGRDFYDFLWYVARGVKPNYAYLEQKLRQSGDWAKDQAFDAPAFGTWAKERIRKLDIEAAKRDVAPFLRDPKVLDGWTKEVFLGALEKI